MKSLVSIPTTEDWGNACMQDLDCSYAHSVFGGKTSEEAKLCFEQNVVERVQDLRVMPSVPFQYYMAAFGEYVVSERAFEVDHPFSPSSAASCFLELIIEKLEEVRESIEPIMVRLLPAIEYVSANQLLYQADEDIFGSFIEKREEIRRLLADA